MTGAAMTAAPAPFHAPARAALAERDPAAKVALVGALWRGIEAGELDCAPVKRDLTPAGPGRPERPELVPPQRVQRRRLGSAAGRAALVHAIAHIEFNAINLALDAALRFPAMPEAYYRDWLSVAADEARHFEMLARRLAELDYSYGDLPAHNGLWEMAEQTARDVLVRMALVPRVLEARGLDVTPGMIERLRGVGDDATVACLQVILEEEVRHVRIGSHWFRHLCAQREHDPDTLFPRLLREYFDGALRGPFNHAARRDAEFSEHELRAIESLGESA